MGVSLLTISDTNSEGALESRVSLAILIIGTSYVITFGVDAFEAWVKKNS